LRSKSYNMLRLKSIAWALGALCAITPFEGRTARAQSTLFNIPSTDVVAPKRTYLEFDFISHLEPHDEGGFQAYVPRAVFGAGRRVEAGVILYTPIANRAGVDTFGLLYTVVSKKVKGAYGPRITGGGYGLVGRANGSGSEGGAILGYEQPVRGRVSFVADWLSGRNRFGYVTPGLSVALPRSSALYAGYSIGNFGRKNNALFVYYGITF